MLEKIFDKGVKFNATTPKGNVIEGLINKKANSNMGSLLIQKVNGKETKQYVQGFPKIHYWDDTHQVSTRVRAYEKLDGSCVAIYPLYDADDNLIELVPKSRGMPVLDENLQVMYDLCDKSNIYKYFNNNPYDILYFEMYGIKNLHSIEYMDTYIDLALIGIYENLRLKNNGLFVPHMFLSGYELDNKAFPYDLKRPSTLFEIVDSYNSSNENEKMVVVRDGFRSKYDWYVKSNKVAFRVPTIYDGILKIREILEEVNTNYKKENKRIATEGVVLNGDDVNNRQIYIKIKPDSIENECRTAHGIPKKFIIKEIHKFFDEYGSKVKEIYLNDPKQIWEFVNTQLSEEFTEDMIKNPKTQRRIEKIFVKVADSKEPPESLNNIAHNLVDKYPKEPINGLMRIFSQEYPYKKKDARLLYFILSKIMKD